jgi:hypothetical protein
VLDIGRGRRWIGRRIEVEAVQGHRRGGVRPRRPRGPVAGDRRLVRCRRTRVRRGGDGWGGRNGGRTGRGGGCTQRAAPRGPRRIPWWRDGRAHLTSLPCPTPTVPTRHCFGGRLPAHRHRFATISGPPGAPRPATPNPSRHPHRRPAARARNGPRGSGARVGSWVGAAAGRPAQPSESMTQPVISGEHRGARPPGRVTERRDG